MSYDISIVQNAQGYFNTSLQTFDLFGAGDRKKRSERGKQQELEKFHSCSDSNTEIK